MKYIQVKRIVLGAVALVFAVAGSGVGLLGQSSAAALGNQCQDVTRTVALAPGQPANQTIKGTLCVPAFYLGDKSVDILTHGALTNKSYWDFPVNPHQYSYVKKVLLSGRATFAYDQLGDGGSSKPVSTDITAAGTSYILHQLVSWLRNDKHYAEVNSVGHSIGAAIAINEAATYNDVDRLVVTSLLHVTTPGQQVVGQSVYPANLDPQFAGQGLDDGYITNIPGTRATIAYSSAADPTVIAYDEAHKDITSGPMQFENIVQTLTPAASNISLGVRVPVLVVVGKNDLLFCSGAVNCNSNASVRQNEAPYFANAPSLTIQTVANTGHSLALHPTAGLSYFGIRTWIQTH
jgi:pimeloyl-ACP methyl ester carboxylesterase